MFIIPKKDADLNFFSTSDIKELDIALSLYGTLSWDEVQKKSCDFAWRSTVKDHVIDWKNIMLENGEEEK